MDMPMKKKRTVASQAAARGPLPALPDGLLDELVKGPMTPGDVQDLMLAFNKAIIERAMSAEMSMVSGGTPSAALRARRSLEASSSTARTPEVRCLLALSLSTSRMPCAGLVTEA
ncbi:hypothetical protein LMG23994_06064 [Cupriavidus pinatubonensis]|uniref:Transposase n=1 Tax=Cupriavidus pinatubonensis TaxID=248026 RepID=A0ABM8Y0L2_9BURK|nr:hypothetical protein LMG23994_06064 [Cupriavidus pinatubonensis]